MAMSAGAKRIRMPHTAHLYLPKMAKLVCQSFDVELKVRILCSVFIKRSIRYVAALLPLREFVIKFPHLGFEFRASTVHHVFGCDSRSPTPESGIVGDKGLAEVGVRRDCSASAGMLAKSEYLLARTH
jgi:hypothetical protein